MSTGGGDFFHSGIYKVEVFDKIQNKFVPTTSGLGMHVEVRDPDDQVVMSRVRNEPLSSRCVMNSDCLWWISDTCLTWSLLSTKISDLCFSRQSEFVDACARVLCFCVLSLSAVVIPGLLSRSCPEIPCSRNPF